MSKRFSFNTKTVFRWISGKEKLKIAKKGSKCTGKAAFPESEMEAVLYREYKSLRKSRGTHNLQEQQDPGVLFCYSDWVV